MGDCLSRPKDSEIEKHKLKQNSEHDSAFIEPLVTYSKPELLTLSLQQLNQLLSKLESERSHFYSKLENTTGGPLPVPKLTIEIQKGVDLYNSACFSASKPYVRVSLESGGPVYTTSISDKYLPEWYKLIEIEQSLDGFKTLRFSIMLDSEKGGKNEDSEVFGKFDVSISELMDQRVFENWIKVGNEANLDLKPRLKIRVQLLHDMSGLYTGIVAQINERIEEVEGAVKRLG